MAKERISDLALLVLTQPPVFFAASQPKGEKKALHWVKISTLILDLFLP
jgi:hypothetical protein